MLAAMFVAGERLLKLTRASIEVRTESDEACTADLALIIAHSKSSKSQQFEFLPDLLQT